VFSGSGSVFKVDRGPAGEKIAYVRMFAGALAVREQTQAGRVTSITVSGQPADELSAGQIGQLRGLAQVRIGDTLGVRSPRSRHRFGPPTLETVLSPLRSRDNGQLHAALTQLAEQDPLINLRLDAGQIMVSLYGEVQKEVLDATLRADYGLAVTFRESTVICVERPAGTGAGAEYMSGADNPFLATVGLRIGPGPAGSGVGFGYEIELGALPLAFLAAIEDTVRTTLTQGLRGWQVSDCVVTLTQSGYAPRQSAVPGALPVLIRAGGLPLAQRVTGAACVVEGTLAAASVPGLERLLPGLTSGEGVLDCAFDHYERVRGPVSCAPSRARTDHNPLDRKEYLLRITRGL